MIYKFIAYGHPNILGTHKNTFEFTKEENISLKGDCIIGVKADFELEKLEKLIKKLKNRKLLIKIKPENSKIASEEIEAELNPTFKDDKELVIRKTNFISDRTLGIKANKAAFELKKDLISYLKKKESKIAVIIKNRHDKR